ncbi:MAG: NADH-quinone oxidoreductase subunit C [Myxococcaceae bacterium]
MAALTFEQLHQKIAAKFGDAIGPAQPPKKDAFCTFAPAKMVEICRFMKADPELAFDHLQDLTATDHPKENLIRVVYHFYSYTHRHLFVAKAELPRAAPEIDTLEGVWKSANWFEREVFDLFGVTFKGHSDLRRIMLPDDWVGHPLRKDYQEAPDYQGISNIRDNPLDLYLTLDRSNRPAPAPVAAAPAAPATPAAPAAPAKSEG